MTDYDRLRESIAADLVTEPWGDGTQNPGWHHQDEMLALCDDFTEAHDHPALAKLDPAGRAEQAAARQALHRYLDAIWEAPKWRHRAPTKSPAYDAVAALRDLFAELVASADNAILAAGDSDPGDED